MQGHLALTFSQVIHISFIPNHPSTWVDICQVTES